ncbi:midasin [Amniculicola lignicola CBS 123094]|uniref:Midasin n=1 Tax=Amniculicola lignicola CBS 123094 TaxID=1392246 RepID=A0A6A5WI95_9PLEO|nr:midasin [Amniculicola lignicola CBS 123094]
MVGYTNIKAGKIADFDGLAEEALNPKSTDTVFTENEGLIVEICARWIADERKSEEKIAAFGRILPLAPHLAEHAERFLESVSTSDIFGLKSDHSSIKSSEQPEPGQLLLGVFRLLSFDCAAFSKYVRPVALERFFLHADRQVRYLAVRSFCIYVHAADYATQEMVKRYLGEGEVMGNWEGEHIDYRFLSLWEEKRWDTLLSRLSPDPGAIHMDLPRKLLQQLSPRTVQVNGVLLPRLDGPPKQAKPFELVSTPTTESNLKKIALGLLQSRPLLLTGLAGSGKTLLTRHFAWQHNKLESMVTLHLNEQSDAKLLVGMYTTGAKPGTFTWRAGVLTTAVREGRWIFIEDLDRAPNEVISTLLPLIERGELLIPSRGETIRAARGFRIIATMRSTLNPRGQEIVPRQNMIGHRFWNSIHVEMASLDEFKSIVLHQYPAIKGHLSTTLKVYSRLLGLYGDAKFSSENGSSLRALTPRDLLKWCERMSVLLTQKSSSTASDKDDMFMEAFDCFAGSLRSEQARFMVMAYVAEELHIDPQRRDHLLSNREVKLEVPGKNTAAGTLRIGRAKLSKHKMSRKPVSGRPFSTNNYTLRLLEKVAVAVDRKEPLLLVGETGTGKTTCIQYLAEQLGRKLVAFNLSQQSESGDLLGGYKPVNVRSLVIPLKDEFDDLFDTTFSRKKNLRFLEMMGKRIAKGEWKRVCTLWREALKMVAAARKAHESQTSSPDPDGGQPKKKRKVDSLPPNFPKARWEKFAVDLGDLEAQLANGSEAFAFSFLEGNIVKAVRNGDWVLLDEINLASSDTLEALADLLGGGPDGTPSILLTETGNVERIVAHPNFRVFAAMNPATDVGKKDLPPGIRSRFTELYVESPDSDIKSLRSIVEKYLAGEATDPTIIKVALDVTNLYLDIQKLAKSNMLVDGADQKPHFSLRTLTRALSYAREIAPLCTLRRALYEGFQMSFITFLGKVSEDLVAPLIKQHIFNQKSSIKTEMGKPLQQPNDGRSYVRQGHYWLRQGTHAVEDQAHYIITPFVQRNMNNLIRASSTRKYPVLIQGPTSSGKTSMIEYLAKRSGNKFVRINNHEHTDLQEYLGTYVSGPDGKLQFQEGILVRALREGHWIVLDELNLAPTDVLEALNRLLDDNRELLIPETQEVVRPHEDFMLFATQNPAGLYGGRKVLSRAFRNRFLELHFDDIPVGELTEILHRRTMIPETWCKRIVKVYEELATLRQENRIFEQKSFATLRDLFRWAQRKADTIHDLANNGYMLLAERVRKEDEREAVRKIIETVMSKNGPGVKIDQDTLFNADTSPEMNLYDERTKSVNGVVWTRAMRRLFVLVAHAIRNNEPVLLVGETGCGKTTVCQMLAEAFQQELHIVNAHQNTETGDLIGAQRPIRNRAAIEDLLRQQLISVIDSVGVQVAVSTLDLSGLFGIYDHLDTSVRETVPILHREEIQLNRIRAAALFEWADGSLVHAMKTGQLFLLDEISLADDSVLERLNSVLESSRTLLLAEKGPVDSLIVASEGFQFMATMNPGGDYGKKELSPALRNRFTEIWVPALSDVEDILQIVQSKLKPSASQYARPIVSFAQWFNKEFNTSVASSISIRDTLSWVTFINNSLNEDSVFGIVHGAAMVFIDTLGANPAGLLAISPTTIDTERKACLHELSRLLEQDASPYYFGRIEVISTSTSLQLGAFAVPRYSAGSEDIAFSLDAPTTRSNAMRVVRALQLPKPILLEGNPGVGKTTLITAIARAIGKPLTRLNLSEQTDLMDLFGSDVPVEGGQAGTFAWRDAPFLKAMKKGDWVLLDEMNLASQSVLEGLNAVLDHRGEVYISELDQTFHKHLDFRVFAAQNPHHQGGGRKGLPASFVNRFTVVYADVFRPEDLSLICKKVFPGIEAAEVRKLISFVATLDDEVVLRRSFGALGSPWEFNLRDTLRWLQLLVEHGAGTARDFLDAVFVQRFRIENDRARLLKLFETVYGAHEPRISLYHNLGPSVFQVGLGILHRDQMVSRSITVLPLKVSQLGPMEALMISVQRAWPVILVGPPGSGKTSLLSQLASFTGANLTTFSMNADIDAMDLVGGYEQVDPSRAVHRFLEKLEEVVRRRLASQEEPQQAYLRLIKLMDLDQPDLVDSVLSVLENAAASEGESSESNTLFHELEQLLKIPQQIEGARFQWVDGILIQALEQGRWLVLDNANLCSSAVLDRLNSLLEPNGYLSINEHSTANGEARIVKPHPDFRIFLTTDPRFGELSRAMRNRAVEICLLPDATVDIDSSPRFCPAYPMESQMYRFRHFTQSDETFANTVDVRFDHLALADNTLLQSFRKESIKGLVGRSKPLMSNGVNGHTNGSLSQDRHLHVNEDFDLFTQFLTHVWNGKAAHLHSQCGTLGVREEQLQVLPYHPLNDELCLQRNADTRSLGEWFFVFYDMYLGFYNMQQAIQEIPSMKRERRKEKQGLPNFLQTCLRSLLQCAEATWNIHGPEHAIPSLNGLLILFWALLHMASGNTFDRATFQTYLKMLNVELAALGLSTSPPVLLLQSSVTKELIIFGSGVQLKTGLSMERIWRYFKPVTARTSQQLAAILTLEGLADRLDAAMWTSNLNPDEMIQIRERFASSLHLVRTEEVDAKELITSLQSAVQELEDSIAEEDVAINPYFEDEFEGLCQFIDVLEGLPNGTTLATSDLTDMVNVLRAKAALFARRPTRSFATDTTHSPAQVYASLSRFVGISSASGHEMVLRGRFHVSVLDKLRGSDAVPLSQLERFEAELKSLSQQIVLDSERVSQDQYQTLSAVLRSRVKELFESHSDIIALVDNSALKLNDYVQIQDQYHDALQKSFARCQAHQEVFNKDSMITAQAWVDLALTGLELYVPNYPFDPALRPMIERKIFNEQKTMLVKKLQSLRQFQMGFTGQDTSFRIRKIEHEIDQMGAEPPVPPIARPEVSELDALQGEFSNLLSILQPLFEGRLAAQEAAKDSTLRQNLSHIITRLVDKYRSYDDITTPAVGFLVCLNIGLALGVRTLDEDSNVARSFKYITQHTPFFGVEGDTLQIADTMVTSCESELVQGHHAIDLRWHALNSLAILRTVNPVQMSGTGVRGLIHNIFASFYGEWKQRLVQDQDTEAKNHSLYTYKGDDEEVDEEDPTLFPDYEKEEGSGPPASSTSREHAIRLANIHAEIFLTPASSTDATKRLLEWSAAQVSRFADGEAQGTTHESAMSAIFLALEKKSDALATSGTGKLYNFYFDANLPEAKRMIALIHRIQQRYRAIRRVWPEHATLTEVLNTCDEALAFSHVDPIAKLITKAEKLHGYVYEWQRVASREFNTTILYDDLTKLLVSWRQLELTTWARLFDIETEKFRDNAKSWFFVAYETIVAASESIDDEKTMQTFAKQLLSTLESFFSSTSLGQFQERIKLLRQLHGHIAMRMPDAEFFKHINVALDNFIAYFSRLEKPVHEALAKGRQTLEKKVNEVIKLASWKDTNIEALKQSARTSHKKLSRLVRKFRNLLNQPVSGIYKAGFPEETLLTGDNTMQVIVTEVDRSALEMCETSILGWAEKPGQDEKFKRFKKVATTVSIMRKLTVPSSESVPGATDVENFITDLEISIKELQKATPATLTEENKETVQHLKTQKRKLYADALKELRQMGFRHNLSSDLLEKQQDLATVLATLPLLSDGSGREAEYYMHKTLHLMSQVRELYKEHSGDLTMNDIGRSIGFLEGILHASIQQRSVLSKAVTNVARLELPIKKVASICLAPNDSITKVSTEQVSATGDSRSRISWLATILRTAVDIISAQAKLGKTNEFEALLRGLRDWSAQFQNLVDSFDALPVLPANIWSEAYTLLNGQIDQKLVEFHENFKNWEADCPLARSTLKQIYPYIFEQTRLENVDVSESTRIPLEAHSETIFAALDGILGSMQDVATALKDIPTLAENMAWLLKEEQALSTALSAFHTSYNVDALNNVLNNLQKNEHLGAATALFTAVQPILQQYLASHYFLVQRFEALHTATTKLLHRLVKSFIQVGTQGLCTPPEKSAGDQQGKDEKLESGTGLGEGEGAEDISKDIKDDEDLEELAQEQNGEREGSIEEQDDAVDMGDQEMEGETGDVAEKEDQDGEGEEGEEDDAESEMGSVDDLGPSAVDEKMWDDGGKDEDAKEKEGKEDVGTENQDEQVASEEKDKKGEEGKEGEKEEGKEEGADEDEDMDMEGEEQDENVGVGETEQMDPHAKEEQTLDLPDELNIDGNDDDKADEDLGDMDDDDMGEEQEADAGAQPDTIDEEVGPEQEGEDEKDTTGHAEDKDEKGTDDEEESDEPVDDDMIPLPDEQTPDEPSKADDDTRADPYAEAGAGADANEEAQQKQNDQPTESAANQQEGTQGETSEKQQESTAEEGTLGQTAQPDAGGRGEEPEESPETQSFKKIGDALERWYNQQKQISEATKKDESQVQQIDQEVDMADAEFEHLPDEETKADTQALGTASEEQAKALDQDMAMAVDEDEKVLARPEDKDEQIQDADQDVDMQDAEPEQQEQQPSTTDGHPQAFVGEQKPFTDQEDQDMADATSAQDEFSDTSSVHEVETQLELTHLDPSILPTSETARALWLHHEASTHSLSQQLTEHLRLILAPTLATKLRGDFRTGKRLNLKRIIPYIASSYKRDKIWLRRSMPSKRNYQVMIALDDSKSMAESGASNLALKTLTLVTRSLAMLEVGEVSVVGFGDEINVAHDFDKPFTSEAGVKVFEQFGFQASKTNVRGLVEKSLGLFEEARRTGASTAGEDLWQLMLVVSDGICDSHADIQRLVRRAQEERVMIVFIIIDATAGAPVVADPKSAGVGAQGETVSVMPEKKDKTSILDLQSVEISPEGKVVRWKYMERFPFRYYLVVRDVRELPGVLAGALRQWFGEVAGSV